MFMCLLLIKPICGSAYFCSAVLLAVSTTSAAPASIISATHSMG